MAHSDTSHVRYQQLGGDVSRENSAETWSSVESGELDSAAGSLCHANRKQKLILAYLALSNVLAFMALTILAPFYPKEADIRGISNTMSGWVFGVFALVQFLTGPLFGRILPLLGSRYLFIAGLFFTGGCTILFGMLGFLPQEEEYRTIFLVFSYILRIALALGATASGTANLAIAASTFPAATATAVGILETSVGIGVMVGPALGGILYEVGGFLLPCVVVGGCMMALVPFLFFVIPCQSNDEEWGGGNGSLWSLLKHPTSWVAMLTSMLGAVVWIVLDPTLEPHMRKFGWSPSKVGLLFLLQAGCYAICAPITGWLADKMTNSTPLMVLGFLMAAIGMMLIGPSPLLFTDDSGLIWLCVCSLAILGVALSLAIVPTFGKLLDAAAKSDPELSMFSHSTVAGLWYSSYALGEFIGPVWAGWQEDRSGFAWCMTYVAAVCVVMTFILIIQWIVEFQRSSKCGPRKVIVFEEGDTDIQNSETTSLLSDLARDPEHDGRTRWRPIIRRSMSLSNIYWDKHKHSARSSLRRNSLTSSASVEVGAGWVTS